jgi:hypothetical protein
MSEPEKPSKANIAVEETEAIKFADFLQRIPPGQRMEVADLFEVRVSPTRASYWVLMTPEIELHCPSDRCNGPRFFRCSNDAISLGDNERSRLLYLTYVCSNCREGRKIFSLYVQPEMQGRNLCWE